MNRIVLISFWKISFKYDKYVENWIFCIDEPVFKIITVFEMIFMMKPFCLPAMPRSGIGMLNMHII